MGVNVNCKTKAKASLKLYNQIASYIFEEEFGEMQGNSKIKGALDRTREALIEIIKSKQ